MLKRTLFFLMIVSPVGASAQTVEESAAIAADAAQRAEAALQIAVPTGAVMAFDLPECPRGWSEFEALAGRVILGSGEGNRDELDRLLTPREYTQYGGAETHTLSESEIPAHSHTFTDDYYATVDGGQGIGGSGQRGDPSGPQTEDRTAVVGGGQPHNNMPPYYVLTMCRRD